MMNRQLLTVMVVAVGVCHGAKYNPYKRWIDNCDYPTWTCGCKIIYHYDSDGVFPDVANDANAAYVRDLAPDKYPIRIAGDARRNARTQEALCKGECHDRLNAFLCLDNGGDFSDFSCSAICLKVLALGIFPFDGRPQPCCALWLENGRQWCPKKCSRLLDTVRCLIVPPDASFANNAPDADSHHVFGVEGGCDIDSGVSFPWCDARPVCTD